MTQYKLLWFDVGIKRYTTPSGRDWFGLALWFDVGIKRYTTGIKIHLLTSKVVV